MTTECEQCGKCCKESKPAVTFAEAFKISNLPIEIDFEKLKKQVTVKDSDSTCIFYENNKCIIYEHRPVMCKLHFCKQTVVIPEEIKNKFQKYGSTQLHLSLYHILKDKQNG